MRLVRVYGQAVEVSAPEEGKRRFGVPAGGAFDRESYALTLALLGLKEGAIWEIAGSAEIEIDEDGSLALAGAPVLVSQDGKERAPNAAWPVRAGETVRIGASRTGARVYVGFVPRALPARRLAGRPTSLEPGAIRLLAGPDRVDLPLEGWTVAPASDRLGIRLAGPGVPHAVELPSRPTAAGTIQVTPSGMPILLGPDGPTIGGYPQAAVVARADLDRLGQLAVGAAVRFEWMELEEARALFARRQRELERRLAGLRLAR